MSRVVEIDLFRGLALAMILVDHNGGSLLAEGTLRQFAVADASEIFVFLSGYASVAAYTALAGRRDAGAARRRFVHRAKTLYAAYLLMAVMVLGAGWGIASLGVALPSLAWILPPGTALDSPWLAVEVAALHWRPYLTDILPLYIITALLTPWLIPALRRRPWLGLAVSVGVWALAPVLAGVLPARAGETWLFNPFAWQLAFVLGALARLAPAPLPVRAVGPRIALTAAAVAVVIALAVLVAAWSRPDLHEALISPALGEVLYPISKPNLSTLRVVNLLALAWLGAEVIRSGLGARLVPACGALVAAGRNGLPCFVASGPLSILGEAVATDLAGRGVPAAGAGLLSDVLTLSLFFLVAYAADFLTGRARSPAAAAAGAA
jgi:hypothetical protein